MAANRQSKGKRAGLNLFGLIFLLVGVGVLIAGPLHTLWLHADSQDWARVPARIEALSLAHKRDSDGGDQYQVTARYQYRWQGRDYTSTRVSYDGGWDSLESEHRARYQYLNDYYRNGQPISIYVNPDDPQQAFLLRELRWQRMLFMGIFALVFAGAGLAIIWSSRRRGSDPLAIPAGPIFSAERRGHWGLWAFGAVFILISLPVLLALEDEWTKGNKGILFALVFPLVGLLLIGMGVRQFRSWRFYGPAPLTLDPHPGQIGGDIGGRIQVARRWQQQDSYRVTLQCLHAYVSGSGKSRSRKEKLLWQGSQTAYSEGAGRGTEVRFLFQPPTELPASEPTSNNYRFWRLLLIGPRQPVALDRTYTLPVQQGSQRSRVSIPQRFIEDQQQQNQLSALEAAAGEVVLSQISGGIRLFSAAGRHTGMKLGILIFGLIFAASGGFLGHMALQDGIWLWLMAAPFLAIGLLMVWGGIFMLGRSLQVEMTPHEVRWQRRWLGLSISRRLIALSAPLTLSLRRTGGTSDGREHVEYFHLQAKQEGAGQSKPLRLAEDIRGRDVAEALQTEIQRWLSH